MVFALDCLGKTITQTKLNVLTEYAENNNEIILNRAINPFRPVDFANTYCHS